MKLKYILGVATALLLSASNIANASIIETDFTSTDNGFLDTDTGLTWVDVNQFNAGSIDDMHTQALAMGATLATKDQMIELFDNVTDVDSFFEVAGTKFETYIWGYYDDGISEGTGGHAFIKNTGEQTIVDNRGKNDGHRYMGAWAIFASTPSPVDVPEPSTLAIFALGMIGLVSRRNKK